MDEHVLIPRLTYDRSNGLAPYNFTHLHRSHVGQWRDLGKVLQLLRELRDSGTWKGDSLRWLITELEQAVASPT